IHDSRQQNTFKTKHLNIWCGVRSSWMNMVWWHRQSDRSLALEQFEGQPCWMAFDLATRLDLVASMKLFMRIIEGEKHFYAFGRYYAPAARVQEPEKAHYQGWAHDGFLTVTEGNDCDLEAILADVQADRKRFDIKIGAFDPWNSIGL